MKTMKNSDSKITILTILLICLIFIVVIGGLMDYFRILPSNTSDSGKDSPQSLFISTQNDFIDNFLINGQIYKMDIYGDNAYIAAGDLGLYILDISDSLNLKLTSVFNTASFIHDVKVRGHIAYLAADIGGLVLVNVTNPNNPTTIYNYTERISPSSSIQRVLLDGNFAYVQEINNSQYWLRILDISMTMPINITRFRGNRAMWDTMQIVGDYLYTQTEPTAIPKLQVYDISGQLPRLSLIGEIFTTDHINDFYLENDICYAAGSGVKIFDFNNPQAPKQLASWGNRKVDVLTFRDQLIYLSQLEDGKSCFMILNATNPEAPVEAGKYIGTPIISTNDVYISGNFVIFAKNLNSSWSSLDVFKIGEIINPNINLQWFETSNFNSFGTTTDVLRHGSLMFIAENDEYVHIIDVNNLKNPVYLTSYANSSIMWYATAVEGDCLYLGGKYKSPNNNATLHIVNISIPTNPELIKAVNIPSGGNSIRDIWLDGKTAYLAVENWGLQAINISNIENINQLGQFDTTNAQKVVLDGDIAYVCDPVDGLYLLNATDPSNLVNISLVSTPGSANDIWIKGNIAYLADSRIGLSNSSFLILNVSNPSSVSQITSYPLNATLIEFFGNNFAYLVTQKPDHLYILNLTSPSSPNLYSDYNLGTSGAVNAFRVIDEYLFMCSNNDIIIRHLILNYAGDYDADKINGLEELLTWNTNITNPDTDNDLMDDYYEAVLYGQYLDPNNSSDAVLDQDGDNLNNLMEFQWGTLLNLTDTDNDGLSDGDEVLICLTNPLKDDTDNDGIKDFDDDQDNDNLINGWELGNGTNPRVFDSDFDGLNDFEEISIFKLNGTNPDTDLDGLNDFEEVKVYNTNGSAVDTDADGLNDSAEIDIFYTDPNRIDTDNDNLNDSSEIIIYNTNPLIIDTDYDGLNDSAEVTIFLTNPILSDSDYDGLNDFEEIYVYLTNVISNDTDFDGISDGNEIIIYNTNPFLNDTDGDMLNDYFEIFIYLTDASSIDTDMDGLLDSFEFSNGLNPLSIDSDHDNLNDYQEYTYLTNPLLDDTDIDGLLDGMEVYNYLTSPINNDTDGDTLSDGYEIQIYFTNPINNDTDADGLTDAFEIVIGSNPLKMDTDNDYLNDNLEFMFSTNLLNSDTDSDGLLDGMEVFSYLTLPTNNDSDDDSLTDGLEIQVYLTNPNNNDTDADGLTDAFEIAIGSNPLQIDTDNDNLNDYNELLFFTNPLNNDTDGDGIFDGIEVYTYQTSPSNNDSDSDLISDGDEINGIYGYITDPTMWDTDGDQISDLNELNNGSNPLLQDSDSDTLQDYSEFFYSTDINNPDSDFDGLLDGMEIFIFRTSPTNNDTDGDSISDGDEINAVNGYATDPTLADTDADGISDRNELNNKTNPLLRDSDADSLDDLNDFLTANATNPDTDNDGILDGIEIYNFQTSPTNPDTDTDNVTDYDEIYIYHTNPNLPDTDGDGLDDGTEIFYGIDSLIIDTDGDNLNDISELRYKTNATNPDTDGDGIFDGDEVYAYNTDPKNKDSDNDGLSDYAEIVIYGTAPNKLDTDSDGLSDSLEILVYYTNPFLQDTDNDTLLDGAEVLSFHSDPLKLDSDDDGLTDYKEIFITNTDPLSPDTDGDGLIDRLDPLPLTPVFEFEMISIYLGIAVTFFGVGTVLSRRKGYLGGTVCALTVTGITIILNTFLLSGIIIIFSFILAALGVLTVAWLHKSPTFIIDIGGPEEELEEEYERPSEPTIEEKIPKSVTKEPTKLVKTDIKRRIFIQKIGLVLDPPIIKCLTEIEEMIGKPIPFVDKIDQKIFGLQFQKEIIVGLSLYNCGLKSLPESIGNLITLKQLLLRGNKLETLPQSIGHLDSLEELNLYQNNLKAIPLSIGNLKSLKTLNLSWNQLESIPESISQLKSLENLNISGNSLTTLPSSIGELKKLKDFVLLKNKIKDLPDTIKDLNSLQKLNLEKNELESLPDTFGKLESLEKLNLSYNKLKTLPQNFGNLKLLKRLWLAYNPLEELPQSFSELRQLEWLKLSKDQPLDKEVREILDRLKKNNIFVF